MNSRLVLALLAAAIFLGACEKKPVVDPQAQARIAELERQVAERDAEQRGYDRGAAAALAEAKRQAESPPQAQAANTPRPADPDTTADEPEPAPEADTNAPDPSRGQNVDIFYTALAPQGDWMDVADYGYCWQPAVAREQAGWRPYVQGHWVYTEAGWTWVSDESFGWATYHYGSWTRVRSLGWIWVPGRQWAPAWVSWRTGGDYVGWAPLPPSGWGRDRYGADVDTACDISPDTYTFVPTRQLGLANYRGVVIAPEQNVTIINRTVNVTNITVKNKTVINEGPPLDAVNRTSAAPVRRLKLQRDPHPNAANPATVQNGDQITFAAPAINQQPAATKPARVNRRIEPSEVERGARPATPPVAPARQEQPRQVTPSMQPPTSQVPNNVPNPNPAQPDAPRQPRPQPAAPEPTNIPIQPTPEVPARREHHERQQQPQPPQQPRQPATERPPSSSENPRSARGADHTAQPNHPARDAAPAAAAPAATAVPVTP